MDEIWDRPALRARVRRMRADLLFEHLAPGTLRLITESGTAFVQQYCPDRGDYWLAAVERNRSPVAWLRELAAAPRALVSTGSRQLVVHATFHCPARNRWVWSRLVAERPELLADQLGAEVYLVRLRPVPPVRYR